MSGDVVISGTTRKAGRGCQALVGVPGRTARRLPQLRQKGGMQREGPALPCQACCCTTHRLPFRRFRQIRPLRSKPEADAGLAFCRRVAPFGESAGCGAADAAGCHAPPSPAVAGLGQREASGGVFITTMISADVQFQPSSARPHWHRTASLGRILLVARHCLRFVRQPMQEG